MSASIVLGRALTRKWLMALSSGSGRLPENPEHRTARLDSVKTSRPTKPCESPATGELASWTTRGWAVSGPCAARVSLEPMALVRSW